MVRMSHDVSKTQPAVQLPTSMAAAQALTRPCSTGACGWHMHASPGLLQRSTRLEGSLPDAVGAVHPARQGPKGSPAN